MPVSTRNVTTFRPRLPISSLLSCQLLCASFPAIEFTSDWAPVVRGSHHSGQYFATFNDWTSDPVEAPVRISVWQRINSGQSEMLYEYESTATYPPTGSFTMEGNVKLNHGFGWWGDGPIFAPVDAKPITYMIDDVEHSADVASIQYRFDRMTWVPEPSTLALLLIALVVIPLIRRQAAEDGR